MFGRKKGDSSTPIIVIEVVAKDEPKKYVPLKTRDPQALVIADLLLSTPVEEGELPSDLRKWAEQILGRSS